MNQAAEYGNELFSKTNEKFIFALTDHDGIEAVKEALKLIAANPDKYKNLRFVPGVELSFHHISEKGSADYERLKNATGGSELLVHCINPFSGNLNDFINGLYKRRDNMINNMLNELSLVIKGTKFLREEMNISRP